MANIGRMWALFQIFTKSATFQISIILGFVLVTFALFGGQIGHLTIVTIIIKQEFQGNLRTFLSCTGVQR